VVAAGRETGSETNDEARGREMSAMALHPGQLPVSRSGAARRRARAAAPAGRLYLTPRGRAVFVALALLLVAGLVMLGSRAAADAPLSGVEVQRHVVAPGETLWQVASAITPRGHDVRDTVAQLVRMNDLPSAAVQAGQVIVVPVG
jgi:LysM repeat protein